MEVDLTIVSEEEIDYWWEQFRSLTKDEVALLLETMDASSVKENYWRDNPNMDEETVNEVVKSNLLQSYEYHLYNTLNHEAQ